MSNDVILIGFFGEILELCEATDAQVIGCIVPPGDKRHEAFGVEFLGCDDDLPAIQKRYTNAKFVIVPDMPQKRRDIFAQAKLSEDRYAKLIHPEARISKRAKLGAGIVIQNDVIISTNVDVGNFCRFNIGALIMHDCKIGDFCTIAPRASLMGAVTLESNVYLGASATVLSYISVGRGTTIGAAACVTKNIASNAVAVGIPAREKVYNP